MDETVAGIRKRIRQDPEPPDEHCQPESWPGAVRQEYG
jgi:hypothetical protein